MALVNMLEILCWSSSKCFLWINSRHPHLQWRKKENTKTKYIVLLHIYFFEQWQTVLIDKSDLRICLWRQCWFCQYFFQFVFFAWNAFCWLLAIVSTWNAERKSRQKSKAVNESDITPPTTVPSVFAPHNDSFVATEQANNEDDAIERINQFYTH